MSIHAQHIGSMPLSKTKIALIEQNNAIVFYLSHDTAERQMSDTLLQKTEHYRAQAEKALRAAKSDKQYNLCYPLFDKECPCRSKKARNDSVHRMVRIVDGDLHVYDSLEAAIQLGDNVPAVSYEQRCIACNTLDDIRSKKDRIEQEFYVKKLEIEQRIRERN